MEILGSSSWLSAVIQVFCVDVLLGVDNALLIALVCRSLRPEHRVEALVLGAVGAVLFRILLAVGVGFLLRVPLLHLAGAMVLLAIALTISADSEAPAFATPVDKPVPRVRSLPNGIGLVILADAVMSIDNVLAVGAVTEGHTVATLVGLGASVPLVMFGGLLLSRILERARILLTIGAVIVAAIAGSLAVSDPLIASWTSSQAPAWPVIVPVLCALFVGTDAYWRGRSTDSVRGATGLPIVAVQHLSSDGSLVPAQQAMSDRQVGWVVLGLISLGFVLSAVFLVYVVAT